MRKSWVNGATYSRRSDCPEFLGPFHRADGPKTSSCATKQQISVEPFTLTHSFPMQSFSTQHQKTVQRVEKGCTGSKLVKPKVF